MGLIPLRRHFHRLFERARQDRINGEEETIFTRAEEVADRLTRTQYMGVALHGDIHHENIRYSSKRGWLAFDPKGLYGERAFDLANALCNPHIFPDLVLNGDRLRRNVAIFEERLMIPGPRIMAFVFVYAALSACWLMDDGLDPQYALQMAYLADGSRRRA